MEQLTIGIVAKDRATPVLKRVQGAVARIGGVAKRFIPAISGFWAALGGAAAIAAVRACIRASLESASAIESLKLSLDKAGISYAQVKEEIDAWGRSLELNTKFTKDEAIIALTKLIAVTGEYEGMQRAVSIAMDIAAARGSDLRSVSIAIAVAMRGETAMLGELMPAYREELKAIKQISDEKLRKEEIFKLLESRYKGFASAADSTTKALWRVSHEVGNVTASMGDAILASGGVTTALDGLHKVLVTTNEWIKRNQETISSFVKIALLPLITVVKWVVKAFTGLVLIYQSIRKVVLWFTEDSIKAYEKEIKTIKEALESGRYLVYRKKELMERVKDLTEKIIKEKKARASANKELNATLKFLEELDKIEEHVLEGLKKGTNEVKKREEALKAEHKREQELYKTAIEGLKILASLKDKTELATLATKDMEKYEKALHAEMYFGIGTIMSLDEAKKKYLSTVKKTNKATKSLSISTEEMATAYALTMSAILPFPPIVHRMAVDLMAASAEELKAIATGESWRDIIKKNTEAMKARMKAQLDLAKSMLVLRDYAKKEIDAAIKEGEIRGELVREQIEETSRLRLAIAEATNANISDLNRMTIAQAEWAMSWVSVIGKVTTETEFMSRTFSGMASALGEYFTAMIMGSEDAGTAFLEMLRGLMQSISQEAFVNALKCLAYALMYTFLPGMQAAAAGMYAAAAMWAAVGAATSYQL